MSQPINALPDENRYEVVGTPVSYSPQLSTNISVASSSDVNRNPAISDENQSRVLPTVEVATGYPMMQDGRYETPEYVGNKGNQPLPNTELAVGPQSVNTSTEFLRDNSRNGDKLNTI